MKRTLAIVGAGRAGRELGRRLRRLGWKIGAVVARSPASARAAVRVMGAGRPRARLGPEVLDASLLLIATPDDRIAHVARRLARTGRGRLPDLVVLHASGALASDVLAPLARRGAATGSMHPLQTFAHGRPARLHQVCFAIEGHPRARRLAARLARSLGGVPVVLDGRHKAAYHAAGAFASPHLLAIMEAGARLLASAGFRRRNAVRALLPLARQTLENFGRWGPAAAWTGPAARGDRATLAWHERELAKWPQEFGEAYRALTKLQRRLFSRKK